MNRRLTMTVIGAVAGLVLVPGMAASASVPDADGTVHACYGKVGGIVRVIDPTRGERCLSKAESELTLNQAGPAGAPGAPGATGPAGPAPTVAALATGDPHCPAGGAAITDAAGSTAYVCSGAAGADGQDGAPFSGTFTSPNGAYSISVTDQGVAVRHGLTALVLSGDALRIDGDSLQVKISGDAQLETGASLNLKAASSLTMTAGSSWQAKGGSSAEVQSAGSVALNGSLVRLNGTGCHPAARLADSVAVSGSTGVISGGSSTVCIG